MRTLSILLFALLWLPAQAADDFRQKLQPVFAKHCVKCHGGDKVKGKVNLKEIDTTAKFLAKPALIKELIDVLDAGDMPPEDEPPLPPVTRAEMLTTLKALLRTAATGQVAKPNPPRRLNRFQYNYTVRDLFRLNRDVFALSEKLMTRETIYLNAPKVPDRVNVRSLALNPAAGLREVRPFPQDLRASHGFDNQANQLTLSPLLFDAFLRLSVSVVESPDFNENTVGIWNNFFKAPAADAADTDVPAETRQRITDFLQRAFRGPVEKATIDRYTAYALAKLKQEMPYPAVMKKVASAALSSPMFLFHYHTTDPKLAEYALASRLSFFLWASGPDDALLELAGEGELAKPEVLTKTVDRMLADPKVERFLDSFPSQWMQLENILAATPNPQQHRYFSLDKTHPASLQMLIEPLLLFDTVFVENRPITELIQPAFSYRSDFLNDWYSSDLKPIIPSLEKILEENRRNDKNRKDLENVINKTQGEIAALIKPVKQRILEERKKNSGDKKPVDLKPYAAWDFNGDLKSSVGDFPLKAHGKIQFRDGMVVLNRSFLQSANLPIDLKAKSVEVWCKMPTINQRGGGVMGIQGPGDFFDTIVYGERKSRHWISGSNGHSRTLDFPKSTPETEANQLLHLVITYQEDGTTAMYRNGKPYGKPYRRGKATFPKNQTSVIFGLRHLPAGGNKYLFVYVDKARLYTRALNPAEVTASFSGQNLFVTEADAVAAMTSSQEEKYNALAKTLGQAREVLGRVPAPKDTNKIKQNAQKQYDDSFRNKLRGKTFTRQPIDNPRYGGIITSAAMLSMNNGTHRTHPIARGAWIIEVIFNDPPPPPPNDVPPLNEDAGPKNLTIREKFAKHRENADCAGCHSRLDPLGFAMENFDITGRWRDKYPNGRDVDASGTLLRKYPFADPVKFKQSIVTEDKRFAKAFTAHLLRFALARELTPADALTVDQITQATAGEQFKLRPILREVIRSKPFQGR